MLYKKNENQVRLVSLFMADLIYVWAEVPTEVRIEKSLLAQKKSPPQVSGPGSGRIRSLWLWSN